jgi:hypothetical protein
MTFIIIQYEYAIFIIRVCQEKSAYSFFVILLLLQTTVVILQLFIIILYEYEDDELVRVRMPEQKRSQIFCDLAF